MSRTRIALAALAVNLSALAVAGESDLPPLDPRAPAPNTQVETGFEAYRAFTDEPLKNWKDTNREAFEAAVQLGLPGTYANRSPGTGHAGHGMAGDHREQMK
jgi:hypothetical protein